MKLKLDTHNETKILAVTEELASQHVAILKVGLRKMLQTGVQRFILDLSATGPTTPDALKSVAEGARKDADSLGIRLLIVSTLPEISDAPTTDKALALLNEGDGEAPSDSDQPGVEDEALLQARVRKLQRRKAALEQHLAKAGDQDVTSLKKEYSDLVRSVTGLEKLVTSLGIKRKETAFLSSSERKIRRVSEILTAVLEQEGLLPIK